MVASQWRGEYLRSAFTYNQEPRGGHTRLQCNNVLDVVLETMAPILDSQELWMGEHPKFGRHDLLRYNLMRTAMGMYRPLQTDHVWDQEAMHYNAYLASLIPRADYYALQGLTKVDVPLLMEWCSLGWQAIWELGDWMCGDETLVPHKGKRAALIRQYIARKPHTTGIKLYCLCDPDTGFVFDAYLYSGRLTLDDGPTNWAGKASNTEQVWRWHRMLPENVILFGDSAFGSHKVATQLAKDKRPFVLLTKRTAAMVEQASANLDEGNLQTMSCESLKYMVQVYKNPKVGQKAARVVPFLTNCKFPGPPVHHRRGYYLHTLVHKYRTKANGVDGANQMALQLRELGRKKSWTKAVRAFLLRQAMSNAFVAVKQLGLVPHNEPMHEWQWKLIRAVHPPIPRGVPGVHVPKLIPGGVRSQCSWCHQGRVQWMCSGCDARKAFHVDCFAAAHGV
jgi:hypothetical protein